MKNIITFIGKNALYIALIQVIVAILGSLYFSEIRQFQPCVLCWYQRIAIYPLAPILIVGILRKDVSVYFYALPIAICGWIISVYQNLLSYGIIPETAAPCTFGVSCTTKYINWYGFITIPFLSFLALTLIIVVLFLYRQYTRTQNISNN